MRRLLFILSCLFLAASCSYTPEEMVEDYNKNFSPTDGPQEPGKEYWLPSLLEYDNYYIRPHSYLDFEVNSGYVEYAWTLTGADGKSYDIGHAYWTAHINTNELKMDEGVYTLTLRVKNRLGIYYYDTAKVFVEDY
ncbi:MAG: hypothetical protein J1E32_08130 [Treponema sp.]|nr:hypothetical protein [Treponema sp.]